MAGPGGRRRGGDGQPARLDFTLQQLLLVLCAHQEELAGGLEPGNACHGLRFLQQLRRCTDPLTNLRVQALDLPGVQLVDRLGDLNRVFADTQISAAEEGSLPLWR